MEWISTKEQQPPDNAKIIVVYSRSLPYATDLITIACIRYSWEEGYSELGRWLNMKWPSYQVTHWMIAPELPKD